MREEELTKREREQSDADTINALVAEFSRISSARSAHPICLCNSVSTSLLSNETGHYNANLVAGDRSARDSQPLSAEVTPLASVALVDSLDLGPAADAADSAPAAEQKEEVEEEQRTARADELADIDDVRHLK